MKFTNSFLKIMALSLLIIGCVPETGEQKSSSDISKRIEPEEEIFYLIFPRSFFDSNDDRIGDLNGVTQKLDYLQELGVTSIIMTPLYPSIYYHNYFTHDFEGIDPEFGSKDDYLNMVKEIHRQNMKFYMDSEVQYVTKEHPWFGESYQNPSSKYSDYIFYNDSLNSEASTIIFDLRGLKSYDGAYIDITTVNLYNEEVRQYMKNLYAYWVDPNKDGVFDDGVDGFRLDHTMDNLDDKDLLTNMLEGFWRPLIADIKSINPDVKFIAEQSDWDKPNWIDPGYSFYAKAGIDIVYSFGHMFSMFDKKKFENTINEELQKTPTNKYHFLFLDQHDTDRIASTIEGNKTLNKQKAAMLYLSNGIPFIYYGQEIGMRGTSMKDVVLEEMGDGGDILRREAFEWTRDIDAAGMATWYKNIEPYWSKRNIRSDDGISAEEQNADPNSLLNFYRDLLHFRKSNSAITTGKIQITPNPNNSMLTYCRWDDDGKFLLAFNFDNHTVTSEINSQTLPFQISNDTLETMINDGRSSFSYRDNRITISLAENGFIVVKSK